MQGIEITIERIKAGKKQCEIAQKLGIPQTMLSEIELGKRLVDENFVNQILGAINKDNEIIATEVC